MRKTLRVTCWLDDRLRDRGVATRFFVLWWIKPRKDKPPVLSGIYVKDFKTFARFVCRSAGELRLTWFLTVRGRIKRVSL